MKPESQKNIPWAYLTFLILVVLINFALIAPYLLAIYFGWIIATVLTPLHHWLLKKKWNLKHAALFETFLSLFVIILPIAGFGFGLVRSLIRVVKPYAQSGLSMEQWMGKVYAFPLAQQAFDSQEEMTAFINDNSKTVMGNISGVLTGLLASTPAIALQIVLALLATYFILVDGKKFREWMSPRIPLPAETKAEFVRGLTDTAYSSFLSMLAAAIAQSMVVFIGFLVLGVPMPFLALGIAFVCAWFPIFGVTPVWVAAVVFLLVDHQTGKAIGMVGFGVIASLIDNVVRPWVLKGKADMHPLVSLVAIFGGIAYLGIPGVLVGPVLISFGIAFLRAWPSFSKQIGLAPGKTDGSETGQTLNISKE